MPSPYSVVKNQTNSAVGEGQGKKNTGSPQYLFTKRCKTYFAKVFIFLFLHLTIMCYHWSFKHYVCNLV